MKDHLHRVETAKDGHPVKERKFTRVHFLSIDPESIRSKGNDEMAAKLRTAGHQAPQEDDPLQVEDSSDWKDYPNIEKISPQDLKFSTLVAWLVETFLVCVCSKQQIQPNKIFDAMTNDDLTFMFVQAQHNINKWLMIDKAFKLKTFPSWEKFSGPKDVVADKHLTDQEKKTIKAINDTGSEFPSGAGITGKDGRKRYNEITKFFHCTYFDPHPNNEATVLANRNEVIKRLTEFTQERITFQEDEADGMGTAAPPAAPQEGTKQHGKRVRDELLEQIQLASWDEIDGGETVAI